MAIPYGYGGLRIFENPYLTETETVEVTDTLTVRQRWIEPLLHPVTLPFEPWVKTRTRTETRTVPSTKILQTPDGFFMHPIMVQAFRTQLELQMERNPVWIR